MARKCRKFVRRKIKGHTRSVCVSYGGKKRKRRGKKRACKFGVNKNTGACLKNRRPRKSSSRRRRKTGRWGGGAAVVAAGRRCKFGVNKRTGRCLKRRRSKR